MAGKMRSTHGRDYEDGERKAEEPLVEGLVAGRTSPHTYWYPQVL